MVVREGIRLLAATQPKSRKVAGLGKFSSGIPDLGSDKKHLRALDVEGDPARYGVIVALLIARSRASSCAKAIEESAAPLVTCEAVIAESCYLLRETRRRRRGDPGKCRDGCVSYSPATAQAAAPLQRLFRKYHDREMDLADARLVHLAGVLGTGEILTLDHDFEIYRWGTNRPFHLLLKNSAG